MAGPRGLAFNEDKTRIVHLEDGLGLPRFQHPPLPRGATGKLLIKPSKAAVKRIRHRLADEMRRTARLATPRRCIVRLNPIIRGWAAYYRGVVSARCLHSLDNHMWKLTDEWARPHPSGEAKKWIVDRYFGRVPPVPERPLGIR